jgi:hypothetical protein
MNIGGLDYDNDQRLDSLIKDRKYITNNIMPPTPLKTVLRRDELFGTAGSDTIAKFDKSLDPIKLPVKQLQYKIKDMIEPKLYQDPRQIRMFDNIPGVNAQRIQAGTPMDTEYTGIRDLKNMFLGDTKTVKTLGVENPVVANENQGIIGMNLLEKRNNPRISTDFTQSVAENFASQLSSRKELPYIANQELGIVTDKNFNILSVIPGEKGQLTEEGVRAGYQNAKNLGFTDIYTFHTHPLDATLGVPGPSMSRQDMLAFPEISNVAKNDYDLNILGEGIISGDKINLYKFNSPLPESAAADHLSNINNYYTIPEEYMGTSGKEHFKAELDASSKSMGDMSQKYGFDMVNRKVNKAPLKPDVGAMSLSTYPILAGGAIGSGALAYYGNDKFQGSNKTNSLFNNQVQSIPRKSKKSPPKLKLKTKSKKEAPSISKISIKLSNLLNTVKKPSTPKVVKTKSTIKRKPEIQFKIPEIDLNHKQDKTVDFKMPEINLTLNMDKFVLPIVKKRKK